MSKEHDHGNYTLTADGKGDDCDGCDEDCDEEMGDGMGVKRELEWGEIAREVALMNKPYSNAR